MKNLIKLSLVAMVAMATVSCKETQRSSATFVQVTSFEMDEHSVETYYHDGILYAPLLSWDDVCYYNSSSDDINTGFRGGFRVSIRKANDDTSEEFSKVTAADPVGGANGSQCYMVFKQTSSMPETSIDYNLTSFYTASLSSYGCDVCNTLYNKRLGEDGLIGPGDYLKVKIEFYKGTALLGSIEKYLIDYATVTEPKMENEWVGWEMSGGSDSSNTKFSGFDAVKITVETSGENIDPSFCVDNYCVQMAVEY